MKDINIINQNFNFIINIFVDSYLESIDYNRDKIKINEIINNIECETDSYFDLTSNWIFAVYEDKEIKSAINQCIEEKIKNH